VVSCHKTTKKQTKQNLHSSKGLEGALPPPDLNRGDKNHHTTLMVGGLLASIGKLGRKQNPLSPTRLRGRKWQPGGRHEASPPWELQSLQPIPKIVCKSLKFWVKKKKSICLLLKKQII